MISRICDNCGEKSYSSSSRGDWECPYCGRKIDDKEENQKVLN